MRTALIIVNLHKDEPLPPNTLAVLDYGLDGVIVASHDKGVKLHPEIHEEADYVITKAGFSAFEGGTLRPLRNLEDILKDENVTDILVIGVTLEEGVAQTAFDANALGYPTTVDLSAVGESDTLNDAHACKLLENAGVKLVRPI